MARYCCALLTLAARAMAASKDCNILDNDAIGGNCTNDTTALQNTINMVRMAQYLQY